MGAKFEPMGDRVLVQVEKAAELTIGGIVLPPSARETTHHATVIALGHKVEAPLEEGDTVVYSRYGGVEIKVGGEEFLVLREADVLGAVREES